MLSNISSIYTPEVHRRIESKEFGLFFDNAVEETCSAGTMRCYARRIRRKALYFKARTSGFVQNYSERQAPRDQANSAGSIFGIMGLLGQTVQGNYAEAIEDSVIGVVTRDDIVKILRQRPEVSLRLLEVVGNRLRLIEERLVEASYSPVRVRIAHFLLTNTNSKSETLTNFTHEEIGNIIGAARQTVTETLNILQNQGLILIEPKNIRIVDRPGLREIISSSS